MVSSWTIRKGSFVDRHTPGPGGTGPLRYLRTSSDRYWIVMMHEPSPLGFRTRQNIEAEEANVQFKVLAAADDVAWTLTPVWREQSGYVPLASSSPRLTELTYKIHLRTKRGILNEHEGQPVAHFRGICVNFKSLFGNFSRLVYPGLVPHLD